MKRLYVLVLLGLAFSVLPLVAQQNRGQTYAPDRQRGEGPFDRLILRGGTLIDGTGAPPIGPVDIVVEGNVIKRIRRVGYPGLPIQDRRRPKAEAGDKELDVSGMYILPGFVDMHGHIGGRSQGTTAEYVFKLWMAHGITTVRDPGSGNGLDWTLHEKRRSEKNEITAPRITTYITFGWGHDGPIISPEAARQWVRDMKAKGAEGFKFFGYRPDIMKAAIEEAKALGLGTACHHAQMDVARVNVLDTARWGLTTMEHWYGLPEALFDDRTIQDYPTNYNYQNEQHRFAQAGRLWAQAAEPGSARWNKVMEELLALDFTLVPTFTIYEASRDLMRVRRAEWHEEYTLPALWSFFEPSRAAHGSYWFHWTTADEIAWKRNYQKWMRFINEYKNRGGRVCTGSDSGFIYKLYGFGFVRELELFHYSCFHPLEVLRSATLHGAQAINMEDKVGSVEPGKLADFVIVEENPLENFKALYGTGAIKLDENNKARRVGGVKYTIKDGIIFDAKQLLADVRAIVVKAKADSGKGIVQPGMQAPKQP